MKVKKYVASSMPEAMNMIRKELGADAVILNSKEKKSGGLFGLFQKKKIEVVAAIDQQPVPTPLSKKLKSVEPPVSTEPKEDKEVLKELRQLKQLLESKSFQSEHNFPPLLEHAYTYLLDQEINEEFARSIINTINEESGGQELDKEMIKDRLKQRIEQSLPSSPFSGISFEKQIIQFVGPTGVGKTTTLAKVAALSMLEKEKKIAFITADTYRIAAIEQLKTYARILNVPVEVAYSLQDYNKALEKFSTYDLIFVDTAGRNFRDPKYVKELTKLIDFHEYKIETYLVLALTAKATDIHDIYNQFKQIPIEKVIFTKMDETSTYGSIVNIGVTENKSIAYITNGQDVPDDIIKPDKKFISNLLLSRYDYE